MGGTQSRDAQARKIAKDYVVNGFGGPYMLQNLKEDNPLVYMRVVQYIPQIIDNLDLSPSAVKNIGPLRAEDTYDWIRQNN